MPWVSAIHVTVPPSALRRHPGLRLLMKQISADEITHNARCDLMSPL
jgi:hypothetical protein